MSTTYELRPQAYGRRALRRSNAYSTDLVGLRVDPSSRAQQAFTSMADLMPTMCEATSSQIPQGVQGRSLCICCKGSEPRNENGADAPRENGLLIQFESLVQGADPLHQLAA